MTEHTTFICTTEHDGRHCQFCDGGLFTCSVCWSFEGATTSECPGVAMTENQRDGVYAGTLDYRDGAWVTAKSPHTPNRRVTA